MDKQDAIDFIIEESEKNRPASEIAHGLSKELGAPYDVVLGFVNRTLEQRSAFISAVETPSALEGIIPAAPLEPLPAPVDYSAPAIEAAEPPLAPPQAAVSPRLEKYIIDALTNDRKINVIILEVCERAGIEWSHAERIVKEVGAAQRKKIVSRRNRLIIPLTLGAIAIGLGLVYAGIEQIFLAAPAVEVLRTQSFPASIPAAFLSLPAEFSTSVFWALGLGFMLMAGGGIGLFNALKSQME